MYLRGELPPGSPPCASNPFAGPAQPPGYMEYAMLHEVLHTIGLVPQCAPHHTRSGHVSDDPTDLMYAGDEPWTPAALDVGRDDYFEAGVSGCLDLATSPYLEGNPSSACVATRAAVERAKRKVRKARAAVEAARTKRARKRARAQLVKAQKVLRKRQKRRAAACAPVSS
jgi:hypothetical protein